MIRKDLKEPKEKVILVVDDNMSNLTTVKAVLFEQGYRNILTASSGVEAISIVEEKNPNIVILDIMMPDMDGFEVCAKLKASKETSDIPIIILSARTSAKDMQKGFNLGAVNYIEKPFDSNDLIGRIESALKLKDKDKTSQEKVLKDTEDEKVILVVDDNMSNLTTVKSVLTEQGYKNIFTASSGAEALSMVKEKNPNLVILDIMMPDMDGFEVCAKLKASKETSDIPIIILSARTSAKDMQKGFNLGAVNYIEKPFDSNDLIGRIESALKLKRVKLPV